MKNRKGTFVRAMLFYPDGVRTVPLRGYPSVRKVRNTLKSVIKEHGQPLETQVNLYFPNQTATGTTCIPYLPGWRLVEEDRAMEAHASARAKNRPFWGFCGVLLVFGVLSASLLGGVALGGLVLAVGAVLGACMAWDEYRNGPQLLQRDDTLQQEEGTTS